MGLVILKFGGTSLGNSKKIKHVGKIIKNYYQKKNKVIVVASAMSGMTNELIKKSKEISKNFKKSEYDVLVSSGEQISCSLIAGALSELGLNARYWISWQLPILTDENFSSSRIQSINTKEIFSFIKKGGIPVVTGFQGITTKKRITTLGRGGSDASAIALAKFFNADSCIIYTDVEGIYTTDPNSNVKAKKIDKISYEEMLEMSSLGARVMQPISIQDAMLNDIRINVKSTFSKKSGTEITNENEIVKKKVITGITYTKNEAKITLVGVTDKPGVAASIFKPLAQNNINVDMVVQNISDDGKKTDITFTIKKEDLSYALRLIKRNKKIFYKKIIQDDKVSKVSIVGVGMIAAPGVTYRMFQALASKKINIMVISTSEIKISVLIDQRNIKKAIKVLHKEFNLG